MSKLFQLRSFLTYWLDQVDQHSLHSPFYYDLYCKIISQSIDTRKNEVAEQLRERLKSTDHWIIVDDFGAGAVLNGNRRNVKDIARTSLSPQKYSSLYSRLINHFGCKNIIELGTSLGINALYLADTPGTAVTTFEGSSAIADIAKTTFEFAGAGNITLIEGEIKTKLPDFIGNSSKIDFAFLDAHHRFAPTITYFQTILPRIHTKSLVLIDDIHYTSEMEAAWKELRHHPLVYGSIDLFRVGILLFDPSLNKQHVVIQF